MTSDILWTAFRWLGVIYLGWLALKLIIKRESIAFADGHAGVVSAHMLFCEACLLAVTNPKALLFYLALFPQVLEADRSLWA